MLTNTSPTKRTSAKTAGDDEGTAFASLGRGYDVDFSIRTLEEMRRHAPKVGGEVLDGLGKLHELDRSLATREWQHYSRIFATPTAIVAIHVGMSQSPDLATYDVLPYDDLRLDVEDLVDASRDGDIPSATATPHLLFRQFEEALATYQALTAFNRAAEDNHGLVLFDAGYGVN